MTTPVSKPKPKRKPPSAESVARRKLKRAADASKGIKFKSRGPYRCVQVDGQSRTGVHPALKRALFPFWDYDEAKKTGRLKVVPHPRADLFEPATEEDRSKRRLPYSKRLGNKFDTQCGRVTKLIVDGVPIRAFFDAAERKKYAARSRNPLEDPDVRKELAARSKRLTACRTALMPEMRTLIRFLYKHDITPTETQTNVADERLGTRCDLISKDGAMLSCVIELKCGCEKNFSDGRMMLYPFHDRTMIVNGVAVPSPFTTHDEHVLHTLVTHKLFKKSFPGRPMAAPLLVVVNRSGAYGYLPPAWAVTRLPALMAKLRHG
jgi:hypothetical protein